MIDKGESIEIARRYLQEKFKNAEVNIEKVYYYESYEEGYYEITGKLKLITKVKKDERRFTVTVSAERGIVTGYGIR